MREALAYAISGIVHASMLAWMVIGWDEPPQLLPIEVGRASVHLVASKPVIGDPKSVDMLQELVTVVETTLKPDLTVIEVERETTVVEPVTRDETPLEPQENSEFALLIPTPPVQKKFTLIDKPEANPTRQNPAKRKIKMAGLANGFIDGYGKRPPSPSSMGSSGVDTDLPARHSANRPPHYPPESLFAGHEGTVTLRVFVNTAGTVDDLSIERSSGFPPLDESALRAVRNWRFIPGRRGGRPASFQVLVPVRFSIRDATF